MGREIDPDRMKETLRLVYGTMQGALTAAMVHLGDRLGLYRELSDRGAATSVELAERTGLDERWLREWLRQQGAAGILGFDRDERFELSAEGSAVLADEDDPAFAGGVFSQLPSTMAVLERLPEAFRSGLGLPYDAFGADGARGVERGFAPWYRNFLVPVAIPRLDGVRERLEAGAAVADVGCGGGVALLLLAEAFPKSRFRGYDVSGHALERAEQNRREAGVTNVSFHDPRAEPLPHDGTLDLVLTFDCLHDMTQPADVTRAIRAALAPDGVWLIADIKAEDTFHANVDENPMAAMMYGFSVMSCMSSALSEAGGAGLGTLGFPETVAREMTQKAGFSRFRSLDLGHPVNAFYEVRI